MENEKEKNLEYLQRDLKSLGFGEGHGPELKSVITDKPDKFSLLANLEFEKPDGMKDKMRYKVEFSKSEKSDRYFLNNYTATLKNEADPTKDKSQTFYIKKGTGVSAIESYNMLSGRAVHRDMTNREGQEYKAWLQLDFNAKEENGNFKVKQFHQNFGYNLPEVLSKYPIKELDDPNAKIGLLRGLEKGNIRPITLINGTQEEKAFIATAPQFKSVNLYDVNMKPKMQNAEKKQQEPDQKKDQKEQREQKESIKTESDDDESSKNNKKAKRKRVKV